MKKCLISGSFDPITKGHEEMILKSSKLFDVVHVCIFENPEKKHAFSLESRLSFINTLFCKQGNIKVESYNGILVDYVKGNQIDAVVRGIRNSSDFEYEIAMEQVNKNLFEDFQCVYLSPSPNLACVSSSVVRQLLSFGGDISFAVPEKILSDVTAEYAKRNKE